MADDNELDALVDSLLSQGVTAGDLAHMAKQVEREPQLIEKAKKGFSPMPASPSLFGELLAQAKGYGRALGTGVRRGAAFGVASPDNVLERGNVSRPDEIAEARRDVAAADEHPWLAGGAEIWGGLVGSLGVPVAQKLYQGGKGLLAGEKLLDKAGRAVVAGGAGGYTEGVGRSLAKGTETPLEAHSAGVESGKLGAMLGPAAAVGQDGVPHMLRAAKPVVEKLVPEIPMLKRPPSYGATPPSQKYGVPPTKHGAGQLADEAEQKIKGEVAIQKRATEKRLTHVEGPAASAAQGSRLHSSEQVLEELEKDLANPVTRNLRPGARATLMNVRRMLRGQKEPTETVYPATAIRGAGPVGGVEEMLERPVELHPPAAVEEVSTSPAAVFVQRKGRGVGADREQTVSPRSDWYSEEGLPNQVQGRAVTTDSPEPVVVDRIERPGFQGVSTSTYQDDVFEVPIEEVRGRVGGPLTPNRALTADQWHAIKKALDDQINYDVANQHPTDTIIQKYADLIRHEVMPAVAPKMSLADRRAHARRQKLERTEERMRSESEGSLAKQIMRYGDDASGASGMEQRRLDELREQFPYSERLTPYDLEEAFHGPRAVLSEVEERAARQAAQDSLEFQVPSWLGGKGELRLARPFLAKGIHPAAEWGERRLLRPPSVRLPGMVPAFLPPIEQAVLDALESLKREQTGASQ